MELKFEAQHTKFMVANPGKVIHPTGDSANPHLDYGLLAKMRTACPDISGASRNDIAIIGYMDRLVSPTDIRQKYTKARPKTGTIHLNMKFKPQSNY